MAKPTSESVSSTSDAAHDATMSTGNRLAMILAVLVSAAPLTLIGLMGLVGKYAAALYKPELELGAVAAQVAKLGDPGLVAVGMGAGIVGILGCLLFRGALRIGIPVLMIVLCGWATALVLFVLLP